MIAGFFLVLVAVLTFIANLLLKRLELARSDRAKWDAEILKLALKIDKLCDEVAAVGDKNHADYAESILERVTVYAEKTKAMEPPLGRLNFIASRDVSSTGLMLMLAAMRVGHETPEDYYTPEEYEAQQQKLARIPTLSAARKDFTRAVRKELRAHDRRPRRPRNGAAIEVWLPTIVTVVVVVLILIGAAVFD